MARRPSTESKTVGVVGAGAVGLTAARDLARTGWDVTVYEADVVGSGSTGRAAGLIHGAHADALDAAHGRRSVEAFRALSGTGSFQFVETPYVWFATEPGRRADAITDQVDRMRRHDLPVETVSATELTRRWPALQTADVRVAAIAELAGWIDPVEYATVLADQARAAGATIVEETPASIGIDPPTVQTADGRDPVDVVIVTAGAHTKSVFADAGIALPVKPYRVQALTLDGPNIPMFFDVTTGYYARPHPNGVLAGDGTTPVEADPDSWQETADDGFTTVMDDRLRYRVTGIGDRHRAWAGLCTATPDRDPLLGKVRDGVYVGTGWQGHGVMRAPATGSLLANAVRDGRSPEQRFDPQRFDGDEEFEIVEGMTLPDS